MTGQRVGQAASVVERGALQQYPSTRPRSCDNLTHALFPKRAVAARAHAHDPLHSVHDRIAGRVHTIKKLVLRELRDRRGRDKEAGPRRQALGQLPCRASRAARTSDHIKFIGVQRTTKTGLSRAIRRTLGYCRRWEYPATPALMGREPSKEHVALNNPACSRTQVTPGY